MLGHSAPSHTARGLEQSLSCSRDAQKEKSCLQGEPPSSDGMLSLNRKKLIKRTYCDNHQSETRLIGLFRYGEMSIEEKDKISHRYRALEKLKTYLGQQ